MRRTSIQRVAARYLSRQAMLVSHPHAGQLYVIAPEGLSNLLERYDWAGIWEGGQGGQEADRLFRQWGGGIIYRGEGSSEVVVPHEDGYFDAQYDAPLGDPLEGPGRVASRYLKRASTEVLLPFPDSRQSTEFSCGAAAAQAVLYYYGFEYREEKLIEALGSDPKDGTNVGAIVRALLGAGLGVYAGRLTPELIRQALRRGYPVILLVQAWSESPDSVNYGNTYDEGHYVTAIGYRGDTFIFDDPAVMGNRGFLHEEELVERWHDEDGGLKLHHFGILVMGEPKYNPQRMLHIQAARNF